MRIGELSRAGGVPPTTIKYYVREGLLPPGVRTYRNQTEYTDAHVGRLRLIRVLVDVGNVSIEAAKELLMVLGDGRPAWDALVRVHQALGVRRSLVGGPQRAAAIADVAALLDRRGWRIEKNSAGRSILMDVCAVLRVLGHCNVVAAMDDYACAEEAIAATDIALVRAVPGLDRMTETAIVGTILGETMISALRRLAQEHLVGMELPGES
ncbi:MerR family transcriptional regulator [Nocardia sp. NPDC004168]|uniref:MerR family transcriptional regulator n=1 Tax=Nocardia sp. NPDC004168 TaxID=3154452 RepID=UPI0033BC997B